MQKHHRKRLEKAMAIVMFIVVASMVIALFAGGFGNYH